MATSPSPRLNAGMRLGPYEIVSVAGRGGMGEVYRARDTRLGRDVAIKVLPAALGGDAQFRARFEREGKSVSSLNHPHICALYDVGHELVDGSDVHYLVLELIEGESLADRIAKGPLPVERVIALGIQIARSPSGRPRPSPRGRRSPCSRCALRPATRWRTYAQRRTGNGSSPSYPSGETPSCQRRSSSTGTPP